MHLSTLLTSLPFFLLAPLTLAAAVPDTSVADTSLVGTFLAETPLPAELFDLHPNLTLDAIGYVGPSNTTISARGAPKIPAECMFEKQGSSYYYTRFTGLAEGVACFGWVSYPNCGRKPWKDPDWSNVQSAMGQQLAKNGRFKTTTVGHWTAAWTNILVSGGFKSDAAALFDWGFATSASNA